MLNNYYHRLKYLLIFCFLLSSCAPTQQVHNFGTPTISPSPTETLQPLPSPTSLVVEPTSTAFMTSVETQKPKEIVFSPCLAVSPEPPGGNQIPWLLLVESAAVYTIDPDSGLKSAQLIPPPNPSSPLVYDFSLSPDGKWLAYYELLDENDDYLVIEPSSNLLTKSSQGRIVWHSENPFQIQGWLSNESIALRSYRSPDKFASTLIHNPFNDKEYEFFLEELPDYLYYQPGGLQGTLLFAHSNLMPDPTLKRVVYPAINADHYYLAALWDVENKKVLASLRILWDWVYNNDPLWSLDGSDFLIMGLDEKAKTLEWFQVTRDGTIKQLTHFGETLKDASVGRPGRSPDGRYLVFKLYYSMNEDGMYSNGKYFVLDLKSPSLDIFCINSGGKSNPDKPFAWSPDNKYLTITNGDIAYGDAVVILVDLEERKAFQIGNNVHATGWMVKP